MTKKSSTYTRARQSTSDLPSLCTNNILSRVWVTKPALLSWSATSKAHSLGAFANPYTFPTIRYKGAPHPDVIFEMIPSAGGVMYNDPGLSASGCLPCRNAVLASAAWSSQFFLLLPNFWLAPLMYTVSKIISDNRLGVGESRLIMLRSGSLCPSTTTRAFALRGGLPVFLSL